MRPHRFVGFNNTSMFCLVFSNCATGFPVRTALKSTRHCCWHRNFPTFHEHFLLPHNFLALSSFGFAKAHFCFSLRFDASDISFHISGHYVSGLEVVCFLVSLPPDHVYPSGGFSFNIVNLVNLVHVFDNSRSPST